MNILKNNIALYLIFAIVFSALQKARTQESYVLSIPDTSEANKYILKSDGLFKDAKYDSAVFFARKSGAIYEKLKMWREHTRSLNIIAKSYAYNYNYDSALIYINRALNIGSNVCTDQCLECSGQCIEVASAYFNMGYIYYRTGYFSKAVESLKNSLQMRLKFLDENHPDLIACYYMIGKTYAEMSQWEEAKENTQKAMAKALIFYGENNLEVARIYLVMGNLSKDVEQSRQYYQKALSIRTSILGEKHGDVAWCYNNLGLSYTIENLDKTIEYLNKALSIRLGVFGENHADVALSYNNLGVAYALKGEYSKSNEYFEKVLPIQAKFGGPNISWTAAIYCSKGENFEKIGHYEEALQLYKKALAIQLEINDEGNLDLATTYQDLASVYIKTGKPYDAINCLQKAIIVNSKTFRDTSMYANPSPKELPLHINSVIILEHKADAFDNLHNHYSKNIKDLQFAVSTYKLASQYIQEIKYDFHSDNPRLRLSDYCNKIFSKAITLAVKLYHKTAKKEDLNTIFNFFEVNRSATLLQSMNESNAKYFANIPKNLLAKEKDIKYKLALYEDYISEEQGKGKNTDSTHIQQWQNRIFSLNREYDTLIYKFETKYPEYYRLKYRDITVSIKEMQKNVLKLNDALVEYFIGDSRLYIFTITKQKINITSVHKDPLFEDYIRSMKEGLAKRNFRLYTENAYRLYQILIKPIKRNIANKNLIVIPDGILGYIPFETLLTKKADTNIKDYRQLAYLIKDHLITYDYSSTLLYENTIEGRNKSTSHYIGFAPVTFK